MCEKKKPLRLQFTHHSIVCGVEKLCYTLNISAMGRVSLPARTFADMVNDCLAFHHVYAIIVLMLVYLHQGELKQPKSSGYHWGATQ
jgi:hypothetical protein